MVGFGSSKLLAAIGIILLPIPFLNFIGIILVLAGMKGLSEHYNDCSIYQNTIKSIKVGLIGFIAISIVTILGLLNAPSKVWGYEVVIVMAIIYSLTICYCITFILSTFIFRKALYALAGHSKSTYFSKTRSLLVYGALLYYGALPIAIINGRWMSESIMFYSGFPPSAILWLLSLLLSKGQNFNAYPFSYLIPAIILNITLVMGVTCMIIGYRYLISAFSSLKEDTKTPHQTYTHPLTMQSTTNIEAKYCPHCGAPVAPRTSFCTQCGKHLYTS